MTDNWILQARQSLCQTQRADGGWSYREAQESQTEPTVLAALALQAHPDPEDPRGHERIEAACRGLADRQRPDGAVGVSDSIPVPAWPTPLAVLLWAGQNAYPGQRRKAVAWCLSRQGHTFEKTSGSAVGHDTRIAGWPWVEGTHSWLEPTVWTVLALLRHGLESHPRVDDARRLIVDRAIARGGWNVGNSAVFGKPLLPHPGPTGLALLALAALGSKRTSVVGRGLDFLRQSLPQTTAPQSLAWGLLALEAWQQRPASADQWLSNSYEQLAYRQPGPALWAYLLLAASRQSLSQLGITAVSEPKVVAQ